MTLTVNAAPHASFSTGSATSINASTIIGKVFHDKNANGIQDSGEAGIAGVRLVTVTGLMLETDGYGRFHLPSNISSMSNSKGWSRNFILKLDKASLPQGARLSTENPRVIHSDMGLNKVNFGIIL